jgi:hypothetical protein
LIRVFSEDPDFSHTNFIFRARVSSACAFPAFTRIFFIDESTMSFSICTIYQNHWLSYLCCVIYLDLVVGSIEVLALSQQRLQTGIGHDCPKIAAKDDFLRNAGFMQIGKISEAKVAQVRHWRTPEQVRHLIRNIGSAKLFPG